MTFSPSCHGSIREVTLLYLDSALTVDFAGFKVHVPNHCGCMNDIVAIIETTQMIGLHMKCTLYSLGIPAHGLGPCERTTIRKNEWL